MNKHTVTTDPHQATKPQSLSTNSDLGKDWEVLAVYRHRPLFIKTIVNNIICFLFNYWTKVFKHKKILYMFVSKDGSINTANRL